MLKDGREYEEERVYLLSAKCSLILLFLGLICNIISFVTPNWIVSVKEENTGFVKLGLWVACFENFVFPEDYISKEYSGCWYIYYPEFKYISDWLIPPWLYACQVLSILSLILNIISLGLFSMKFIKVIRPSHLKSIIGTIILQAIVSSAFIIVIILIGCYSKNRAWQPRPDHNRVSWSFAFAVLAGFFGVLSIMTLMTNYISWKSKIKSYQMLGEDAKSVIPPSRVGGSAFNPGGSFAQTGTIPSLFNSKVPSGYPIGSHMTHGTQPPPDSSSFHSHFDGQGRPYVVGTSGAAVSDKLREALARQKYDTATENAKNPNPELFYAGQNNNTSTNIIMDSTV